MATWLLVTVISLWAVSPSVGAIGSEVGAPGAAQVAPNEVKLYIMPNFQGPPRSYTLQQGNRHLFEMELPAAWAGKIASIEIGSDVEVMLFQKKYFKFNGSNYVSLASSAADISKRIPGAENKYTSFIIYWKQMKSPLGILAGNSSKSDFRFFALPESAQENYYSWADIRHLMEPIDFILFFSGNQPIGSVSITLWDNISYKGEFLNLPSDSKTDRYYLKDHNFAGRAKSVKIRYSPKVIQMKPINEGVIEHIEVKIPAGTVRKSVGIGRRSISGKAYGPKAHLAPLYVVELYGPNDFKILREKKRFAQDGSYKFTGLPDGEYKIYARPDPGKADIPYELKLPNPIYFITDCNGRNAENLNFAIN